MLHANVIAELKAKRERERAGAGATTTAEGINNAKELERWPRQHHNQLAMAV